MIKAKCSTLYRKVLFRLKSPAEDREFFAKPTVPILF